MAMTPLAISALLVLIAASRVNCDSRPNIVFILADDLGYNDIGYHARGHMSDIKTPFLDQLAADGVKLENYYVQRVCTPTRGQLLTGRYQIHTGLQHRTIRPWQPHALPAHYKLLPEQLKECGYGTHMVGKWHLGNHKTQFMPWRRGFQTYFGILLGSADHFTHERCDHHMCGVDMRSEQGPVNDTWGEYSAHLYARKSIEALENRDRAKPFFLYLSYQSVHRPLQAPEEYIERFKHIRSKERRVYAGMALAMDESVRNVTKYLNESGLLNNTIIVFSSDNGGTGFEGNNWPLRGTKWTLWEGGIKAAGFIYGEPLGVRGRTYTGLLDVSDWFPTLLRAAGDCTVINGTQPLDGIDQWVSIRRNKSSPRKEILHNIDVLNVYRKLHESPVIKYGFDTRIQAAIRVGPWKLLTGDPGEGKWIKPPEFLQKVRSRQRRSQRGSKSRSGSGKHEAPTPKFSISKPKVPFPKPSVRKPQTPVPKLPIRTDDEETLVRLFNIASDPYEKNDVAAKNPDVVERLLRRLSEHLSSSVPPVFPPGDREADPKYLGGYWGPWKD